MLIDFDHHVCGLNPSIEKIACFLSRVVLIIAE